MTEPDVDGNNGAGDREWRKELTDDHTRREGQHGAGDRLGVLVMCGVA
jgi:hypothetical protein